MHNEDYITSGILELYAAGGLTQPEREEVERRAATSPEIRQALDEACAAMEAYAGLYALRPRPDLKNKILQRIESLPQQAAREAGGEAPVRPLYPEKPKESAGYSWMLAASITLFLLSTLASFYFYTQWQRAEEKLTSVLASEQALARNFTQTSLQLQRHQLMLALLRSPQLKTIRLQGVAAHPGASLVVYWNPDRRQVYVDAPNLPAPPTGKQYQLWALLDGKPIDAGLIDLSGKIDSLQQMKDIGAAQAFAVTLEPAGGSKVPTLEQLTVMGKTGS